MLWQRVQGYAQAADSAPLTLAVGCLCRTRHLSHNGRLFLSHELAREDNAEGVVHQTVQNRIGDGWGAQVDRTGYRHYAPRVCMRVTFLFSNKHFLSFANSSVSFF